MNGRFEVIMGDITKMKVDAVVNSANASLLGGDGVDGAIHLAAGPKLFAECLNLNGCKTGRAKITSGYALPADWIIHTVGPVWHGGDKNEPALLASCYQKSLELAVTKGLKTIAFPSISTGIYRYPLDKAAQIAVTEIVEFLEKDDNLDKVTVVCFDPGTFQAYADAAAQRGLHFELKAV